MTIELHLAVTNLDTDDEAVLHATLNIEEARRLAGQPWELPTTSPGYRPRTNADVTTTILTLALDDEAEAAAAIEVVLGDPNALTVDTVAGLAHELATQRAAQARRQAGE